MRKGTLILVIALVVVASLPRSAGAGAGAPTVTLTYNAKTTALPDAAGEVATRVLLNVANAQPDPIVLITVRSPGASTFATVQDPATNGWACSFTRTAMQCVGNLGASPVSFPMRVADLGIRDSWNVELQSAKPATLPFTVSAPLTSAASVIDCRLITDSSADDHHTFLPFATLSPNAVSSAKVVVAVFDHDYRGFYAPRSVTGTVTAVSLNSLAPGSKTFPLTSIAGVPFADSAAGPVFSPAAMTPSAAATLWATQGDAGSSWFLHHPGAVSLSAQVFVDGKLACTNVPFDFGAILAPVAPQASTPFTILPPELDSDADGYTNAVELKSNSVPLSPLSTPYTDDNCNGIPNGRETASLPTCLGA